MVVLFGFGLAGFLVVGFGFRVVGFGVVVVEVVVVSSCVVSSTFGVDSCVFESVISSVLLGVGASVGATGPNLSMRAGVYGF